MKETGGSIGGLFSDQYVMGMLEASDYKNAEKGSLIWGAIYDGCCGFMEAAETTAVYAQYVEIIRKVNNKYENPRWTLSEVRFLKNETEAFLNHCVDFFGPYQAFRMAVSKFHALTNIPDDF